jgi:hypothetical protein
MENVQFESGELCSAIRKRSDRKIHKHISGAIKKDTRAYCIPRHIEALRSTK